MNTHTPGPWVAQENGNIIKEFQVGNAGKPGCAAFVFATGNAEETEANARLIAAAPELLEAAMVFKQYEADFDNGDDISAMFKYAEFVKLLNAAIAKATGEQP